MYNLLLFFARFHAFILFIFLEIICFSLLVQHNPFQRTTIINSSNRVTGELYDKAHSVGEFVALRGENDSLLAENGRLKAQLLSIEERLEDNVNLLFKEEEFCRDSSMLVYFEDTTEYTYNYVGAKVISNSTLKPNNYLTINKGHADGLQDEMGVIGRNGIVGVIKNVSKNFATVISVLHKSMRVSAKIRRNNFIGSLRWDGGDPRYAVLDDIPKHARVNIGDTIVTSGYSSFFPADIVVGVVENWSLAEAEGSNFFNIKVKLSTHFSSIRYVYVVDYAKKQEQKALEEKSRDE